MAMNFRKRHQPEEPEINLIPFIDVLLVVLIFLMLTTTYSKLTELKINLPTANAQAPKARPREVVVVVTADGRYLHQPAHGRRPQRRGAGEWAEQRRWRRQGHDRRARRPMPRPRTSVIKRDGRGTGVSACSQPTSPRKARPRRVRPSPSPDRRVPRGQSDIASCSPHTRHTNSARPSALPQNSTGPGSAPAGSPCCCRRCRC
ncbi:MAG: biopolymer transporter ExbD [Aquabacterium sp.]